MTGTIKYISQPQQITDAFTKAEVVIVTDEQYPQTIKFELHNQYCTELQNKTIGHRIFINFNIRGREHQKQDGTINVYNTLVAWKLTPQ